MNPDSQVTSDTKIHKKSCLVQQMTSWDISYKSFQSLMSDSHFCPKEKRLEEAASNQNMFTGDSHRNI